MRTTVEQRGNELIIITEARRSFDSDWHAMVAHYHTICAAQALEAAIRDGYELLSPKMIGKLYWDDAVLADKDAMARCTVLVMRRGPVS